MSEHNFSAGGSSRPSICRFGHEIYLAREALGWTQAYLGQVTGYTQQTIGAIERSVVFANSATLQDISNALGIEFVIRPG